MTTHTNQRDRQARRSGGWNSTRAARQCASHRDEAARWMDTPIAAGIRAQAELENAATWHAGQGRQTTADKVAMLGDWLQAAYSFATPADLAVAGDTALATMPLISRWLRDRAARVQAAPLIVLSPAAEATVAAAAQALTESDMAVLAAAADQLPYRTAHMHLSEPLLVQRSFEIPADDVLALSWWGDDTRDARLRIVDWIASDGPVRVPEFERARNAVQRMGGPMPGLYLNGERAIISGGQHLEVADDIITSEGHFTFDDPVFDPEWDFVPRFVLALRHLVAADELQVSEVSVMRPNSRAAGEQRIAVDVITTRDDAEHTAAARSAGVMTAKGRKRIASRIHWQPTHLFGR